MSRKIKVGIVGFGNMGQAIAQQLKLSYEIYVFDKDPEKIKNASGIITIQKIGDILDIADLLILAVKPQDFRALLDTIKIFGSKKLVISIAAGIPTSFIENYLDAGVRVIRAMPNLPAKIGRGMSCLCKGKSANDEDMIIAKAIFKQLGETLIFDENMDEEMMDTATAISGSGPGYLCDFIELNDSSPTTIEKFQKDLREAAIESGFSKNNATELAATTTAGTMAMLEVSKLTPSQLKEQVTSRGGTTEAGLKAWHEEGSLIAGIRAAYKRAKELFEQIKGEMK